VTSATVVALLQQPVVSADLTALARLRQQQQQQQQPQVSEDLRDSLRLVYQSRFPAPLGDSSGRPSTRLSWGNQGTQLMCAPMLLRFHLRRGSHA